MNWASDHDASIEKLERVQGSLTVDLIMAPRALLLTCAADETAEAVMRRNAERYSYLPVIDDHGEIIGLYNAERWFDQPAPAARVGDDYQRLSEKIVIGADASIFNFIQQADRHPTNLVISRNQIAGLVSLSDIQQLPVRASLFALITSFEMAMASLIIHRWPSSEEWIAKLSDGRRQRLQDEVQQARESDSFVSEVHFTQFSDKTDLIRKEKLLGVEVEGLERRLKEIRELRDMVAHANSYADTPERSRKVCKVVRSIYQIKHQVLQAISSKSEGHAVMVHDETEAETRADRIDPALRAAGWGVVEGSRVRREIICPGRILSGGRRGEALKSDYVLLYKGHKLATLEAKKASLGHTEGVGQAKDYATRLGARFAYSSNGIGWYEVDMETGAERDIAPFPSPDDLWRRVFPEGNDWRDRFGAAPFEDGGGKWQPRYYQHRAITAVLEAIAKGDRRILLTLATGTGKTGIAFQIAWKLFHARWNLTGKPTRRPRILFLADRNILANQAYNAFSAFPADALARVNPREIAKKKGVPKNASVFFTIFQTFMTQDAETEIAGDPEFRFEGYEKDFFDFIIIDECHRGGAKDESAWRGILEYFSPAVQLGLTATPKRVHNADTYAYFGEPVYAYALKEGIEDGFLTPFKVRQMASTIDEYVYDASDTVLSGEIEEGRRYVEGDFNTEIVMEEREMSRVQEFMGQIDHRQKTLVFCANQTHAARVRDFINQVKTSTDPNYCHRVTAEDGERGEAWLRTFQDNEKTIPTILTTSHKLSTGVDALNVRNIVLMRPIKSMIEFKQIIGRGTRVFDGKDFFTIYDFVKAYDHFSDPEWDGEPLEPVSPAPRKPREEKQPDGMEVKGRDFDEESVQKAVVKLGDGRARKIQYIASTSYWMNGKVVSAREFIERLFGDLAGLIEDEDELRRTWSDPDTRAGFLKQLEEKGFGPGELSTIRRLIDAQDSDIFDVLAYVRFAMKPKSRATRADRARRSALPAHKGEMRAFLEAVLAAYEITGSEELSLESLPALLTVKYGGLSDAKARLGDVGDIRQAFVGIQADIYRG